MRRGTNPQAMNHQNEEENMKRNQIVEKFAWSYFDAESLLTLIEDYMAERWIELEENPNDESISDSMEQTKLDLAETFSKLTELSKREVNEILVGMRQSHANELKTISNWRDRMNKGPVNRS